MTNDQTVYRIDGALPLWASAEWLLHRENLLCSYMIENMPDGMCVQIVAHEVARGGKLLVMLEMWCETDESLWTIPTCTLGKVKLVEKRPLGEAGYRTRVFIEFSPGPPVTPLAAQIWTWVEERLSSPNQRIVAHPHLYGEAFMPAAKAFQVPGGAR